MKKKAAIDLASYIPAISTICVSLRDTKLKNRALITTLQNLTYLPNKEIKEIASIIKRFEKNIPKRK